MTDCRASIIIVAYNSARYLRACLDSVQADMGPDDELIVVDNGSGDGGADLVAAEYPRARLLREANIGYAGGNNRGAAIARGRLLVFLNPDTVAEPGTIDALLEPLEREPQVGLSTARVVHMDRPEVINTCGNTMHYTGLTYCRGAGQPREVFAQAGEVDAISGAACAISSELFDRLGGFDERFFMYVEDTDLSWRARLAGYRCWLAPAAVVRHDYRPSYTPGKAFFLDRNRLFLLLKHLPGALLLRLLPALLLSEAVTWGFMLLKGPRFWLVKLRVYAWILSTWRIIRAERHQSVIQRDRLRVFLRTLTHRLEFGQLAGRRLAQAAGWVFHPAYWLAQRLVGTA